MSIFLKSVFVINYLKESLLYLVFVFFLTGVLIFLGLFVGQKWRSEWAKLTAFECGFDSLSSARNPFSLRFFLLALLFLVFDVEIILLFPYIFSVVILWVKMSQFSKMMCFLFLVVLVVGLFHELNEGTLDWKFD
uniref:NADH-ubiquinone oxidoreductase chain 3 n=2 Tax=Dosinia TaxID=61344 RepID=A0A2U8JFA1_9BIVA|nr:NADH dehydrogenase subunit 3 [Dosinia troscheli]YP_009498480.1 NADH dehydrogenase subunit 3 [Dosinia japonica]AWI68007.1 NADH dehydrogenase subunit 3 [Dosinia troscheli]AWK60552.1 NADH dehydrogenase subunit 3 [Dosinia japonica]